MRGAVLNRDRSRPHYQRKLYHALMGLLCFALYAFALDRGTAIWLIASIGGCFVILDLLRLRIPSLNQLTLALLGPLMRREELGSVTGNSFYILGLFVAVTLFSKPVALLSILFLALGDPIAAVVGTKWGRTKIFGDKSLEGSLANFALTALASFLFSALYLHMDPLSAVAFGIFGGLVSMLAELFPAPFDDNLTIPAVSALLLTAGFAILF